MMMTVTFKGYSAHDGNKGAVNLNFAAEDGTQVNMTCAAAALSMVELGEVYVISVDKIVPNVADVAEGSQAGPLPPTGVRLGDGEEKPPERIVVNPDEAIANGGQHA